jgi:hypothetical protein
MMSRPPRRKRALAIKGPSEHVIQCRLMRTLDYALKPELDVRALPNGGLRKMSVAIKLKAEGVKRGTPDIMVLLHKGRTGWLELKTEIGSLQQEQKDFRDKAILLGHLWAMARSVEEAMVVLTAWGAIREEYMEEANDPYRDYYDSLGSAA